MENNIIDILKRIGKDIANERESACLVSIHYNNRSSSYSTSRHEIDYEIAKKLESGSKYIDYDREYNSCQIYVIKDKLRDKFDNIILIVEDDERISFE